MEQKHTPTPWEYIESDSIGYDRIVSFGRRDFDAPKMPVEIARVSLPAILSVTEAEAMKAANAALIVTAVNSYDSQQETIRDLTEALHTLADELTCGAPKGRFSKERVKTWTGTLAQMARHAALDRAKKGT